MKPLGNFVLIAKKAVEEKTPGGIIIPDMAKERPQWGTVRSIGPGKMGDDGVRVPMELAPDDEVLFSKFHGSELKVDDEDCLLVEESKVFASR